MLVWSCLLAAILACTPALAATGVGAAAVHDSSTSEDAGALIAQVAKAYGGRAALEKVSAYRAEGRIVALAQRREGPTSRLFWRPGRLRVELRYPDAPETRIVDGTRGWRGDGGGMEPASGPMLDAMILQAARAGVPWVLIEHVRDARRIAPREHRGRMLLGIELQLGRGLTLRAYVDPATHRVERSEGRLTHGGMETTFETVYEDFRPVRGVLFAFREENYASGVHTGYTALERVEINPPCGRADFAPPPAKNSDT